MIPGGRLRGSLLIFILVVAVTGLAIGLRSGGPANVSEVPATLPKGGVIISGQIVLKPLTPPPPVALSKAAAIEKARGYATDRHFPATALEASITAAGNSHVQNVPAWVVTFTSPKATNVSQGKTPLFVKHYSVAIDVRTGKLLVGFFTK